MTNVSYEKQMSVIAEILKSEIVKLDNLPKEEAKKEAHKGLVKVGIIDDNGNFTEPYIALSDLYIVKNAGEEVCV